MLCLVMVSSLQESASRLTVSPQRPRSGGAPPSRRRWNFANECVVVGVFVQGHGVCDVRAMIGGTTHRRRRCGLDDVRAISSLSLREAPGFFDSGQPPGIVQIEIKAILRQFMLVLSLL